jgi:hypothetical protein
MKQKTWMCTILCGIAAMSLNAQDLERRERMEAGVKAGVNISNVWDSKGNEFSADPKTGLAAGVFVGIPIGKFIGIQPEILLSQKGFTGSGSLLSFPYTVSRTTTYLDVPLQLQLKPAEFITFLGGPQFSYLLNQKDKYTFDNNSTEQEQEFNNDNIRKNILGFVAGVDLLYQQFVLSGRVGWDFQTNAGDGSSLTPRYKNQWLQFTAGIKI